MADLAADRTLITPGPAASALEATQVGGTLECPVCQTANPALETWCAECGFRLADTPGDVPEPAAVPARLVALVGGHEYALRAGENYVGREACEVLVAEPSVSRRHAVLRLAGRSTDIEDLGSTNGTFVDGARLPSGAVQPLRNGAEVRFGEMAFRLALEGADDATDTPAPEALPDGPWLEADDGTRFAVPEGEGSVGRRSSNNLMVQDPYASGQHARLTRDGVALRVEDLDSTNGTFVNGDRLEAGAPVALHSGDTVAFGRKLWIVHGAPDLAAVPAEEEAEPAEQAEAEPA